ncbi:MULTISPECIES: CBS domain-containing protein [unclassified Thalassotalea]|uniref:CBS domain-containing protein n=1 Tax=unclassified Thalassotalea TaxID=2614972 RepID=UPI001080A7D8|nr:MULTISPECIES: CBS domain-containing protein [unclassified Thalassotalea]NMP17412.1 CBS domain-containing protein [Thalassotalea sp. Y01]QBY02880.1 CBS domain-containing protein [Thalassotalea sp. HSM 43]
MESLKVKDYLNSHPVTFRRKMPIEEASGLLTKTHEIGGPVLDKYGNLVGFLSESDVLEKILETGYFREHCCEVENLMRTDVLTVKPYDSIVELAQTMLQHKPKVYPVVDDDGNLLGTISRSDVLSAIDTHISALYQVQN